MAETFSEFESRHRALGYTEVLERRWEPGAVMGSHTHPWDATAVVVQGEMWLTVGAATVHIVPGGGFEIDRGQPHAERYGSEGTLLWAARRH